MRLVVLTLALVAVAGAAAAAAAAEPPAPEIDVIVNSGSAVRSISESDLAQVFSGSRNTLPDGRNVIPFNLPTSNAIRVEFDRVILNMTPFEVGRYWVDQRIRGAARPPRQVSDPDLMAKLVARLPGTIGYVPAGLAVEGTRVVARIRNHGVREP